MKTRKQIEKEQKELEKELEKVEEAEERRQLKKEQEDMKKISGTCWAIFYKGKPIYTGSTKGEVIQTFLYNEDNDTRDGGWGWTFYKQSGNSVKKIEWKIVK